MSTGFPDADARDDFQRARRRHTLAQVGRRLRREPDDIGVILPFEEVVAALGRVGERNLGVQVIDLDSVVGTVDRTAEFDRRFRPTTARLRGRWERMAAAMRRGEPLPPIDVYRVGEAHFVKDGHHRVSVARHLGRTDIDAHVTEVLTAVGADRTITLADLPLKSHERIFNERVPLAPAARERIRPADATRYAVLAEGIEAWGFRLMQERQDFVDRATVARLWYEDEYLPVVEALRRADMLDGDTECDAYMRVANARYMLLRTHAWGDDVLAQVRHGSPPTRRFML